MQSVLFRLLDGYSLFDAQRELEKLGLSDLYTIEDDSSGEILIGGSAHQTIAPKTCYLTETKESIDWSEQWSQFAEDFREGKAHIDLARFGAPHTLLLLPGPGFGDLSHPTTYLMLELMAGCLKDEIVLDIGCGSGILSLAALLMGAKSAFGIDIDENALNHAQQNAALNHLDKRAHFSRHLPTNQESSIVLINMILPEQRTALKEISTLPKMAKLWIASGILKSQRADALALCKDLGLTLIEEKKRGEWLGLKFLSKHDLKRIS